MCPQPLLLFSPALWCMRTRPIHYSQALILLSFLLLLARDHWLLPMASHHYKRLQDK
jgi:hypothetical protein